MTKSRIEIRPGGVDDVPAVLDMLDSAIEWLTRRGYRAQWGTEPASRRSKFIDQVTGYAAGGGLHLAILDGRPAGALSVGAATPYVPAVDEPELYVQLLITHRACAGAHVGARLLEHAEHLAREASVGLLRVDCFAGNDGRLVGYYESQGFTRTDTFTVQQPAGPWHGQVLQRRLPTS